MKIPYIVAIHTDGSIHHTPQKIEGIRITHTEIKSEKASLHDLLGAAVVAVVP